LPGERGRAFGLHRALDTAGAVIGPLTALALLGLFNGDFRLVFFVAAVPACVGVGLLVLLVREPAHAFHPATFRIPLSPARYGRRFTMFLLASTIFAVGNSSDAFLLLRSQSVGFSVNATLLLYVAFNVVYSLLSFPMGKLADRFGKMRVLLGSFVLFAVVYGGLGIASGPMLVGLLFPVYGVYMAMSEGISKAYIVDCVPPSEKASALGLFATLTGAGTLVASPLAGYLWSAIAPAAPFYLGAVCAAGAAILLLLTRT
jgi:MFS family permease